MNRKRLEQWQLQWNNAAKEAVYRSFLPNLEQMLKTKIPITPEFTALVTGHGINQVLPKQIKASKRPHVSL
jgi:hypothetical protein